MSIHTKQPQVDLRFFELPATIALIEAIRNPLIIDLKHKKFKKLTSQELSIFLGRLQIFQEEKLGTRLNISKKSTIPTKIPSKLFKFGSTTLTTKSPIYHILKSAYKFKYSKKWDKWNWDDVEDIMEMITMIRGALIKKKIIKIPIIQFSHSLDSKTIKKLKKLVKRLGGQVADDDDQNVTHIIHKSNDYDDQDEEWFRTLEKKDGKVLMHWWYYPDSYDTWVEETSEHANPEPAPINNGPWNVGKRWINDSIKFNDNSSSNNFSFNYDNNENLIRNLILLKGEKIYYNHSQQKQKLGEDDARQQNSSLFLKGNLSDFPYELCYKSVSSSLWYSFVKYRFVVSKKPQQNYQNYQLFTTFKSTDKSFFGRMVTPEFDDDDHGENFEFKISDQ
ncbi:2380_t:CDS:2, partial [Entrophospora sp. SA101]